jgi:predicted PurR-regulated permease PerM
MQAFIFRRDWPWLLAALLLVLLFKLLSPVFAPFVVAAIFAYMFNPLVNKMQRRLGRNFSVALIFLLMSLAGTVFLLIVVPLLYQQISKLVALIPQWLDWLESHGLPALGLKLPEGITLDFNGLKHYLGSHADETSSFLSEVLGPLGKSSLKLASFVAHVLLIPVIAFYLLRDWNHLTAWIENLFPERLRHKVRKLAQETDDVLGSFLRGQLTLMVIQGLIYVLGLWAIGLDFALLVGILAGLVSFVPYLGFISGMLMGVIAMIMQGGDTLHVGYVVAVFVVGHGLEHALISPIFVGHSIGLHPVAVIFSVLAGGHLYGFVGVLMALPVAAIIAVLLRHAKQYWFQSALYQEPAPNPTPDPAPDPLHTS